MILAYVLGNILTVTSCADDISKPIPRDQAEFFESKIRPVLVQHCERCHGAKKQESGLRLDNRSGFLKGADAGPVVEPGKPEESSLVEAVSHKGPVKMPPNSRLPESAIADINTWIRMGTPWPEDASASQATPGAASRVDGRDHWAYQPIRKPSLPDVHDPSRAETPVDRFILAKLDAKGLAMSPRADARTLIRRATFDLIGLPPSPEEIAAFEADTAPDAYARLIDRLLASPQYGERWGRHWLDVARYSDTKGYALFQDANFPWAFTYRDYVVRAFNADLPYDRFLVEQIAADRLLAEDPKADRRALPALGFVTVGGRFMNNVHDVIDDRIDVVTRGLMGMTVACARCHDHKFDPIPASDYYALYGVFNNSSEPTVPPEYQDPPRTEAYAKYLKELDTRERALKAYVAKKHAELVSSSKSRAAEYLLAAQKALDQPTTEEFMLLADGSDLNPTMVIRWQSFLARTRKEKDAVFAPWHTLAALKPEEFASKCQEVIAKQKGTANRVVLDALDSERPGSMNEVAAIYSRLLNAADKMGMEASLRASLEKNPGRTLPTAEWEAFRAVFLRPDSPPNIPLQPFGDLALFPDRPSQAEVQKLRTAFETWLNTGAGAPNRAMALEDAAAPVDQRVFLRGNPNNLGEAAPRRFLTILSARPFRDGSGRLELARAIASEDNPLTARVLVNRVWMIHMGTPLVSTPGDFGLRSDPPTHPELLDDLAASFVESGWSIKALHRRIMLSAAYQQESLDRSDLRAVDPENALYGRMNRRRLDFESLRDSILAVCGRLDPAMGGPARPSATDAATPRRTLYTKIDRLDLPGLLRTFDFPDPNTSSSRRDQSTVAPQALFLMNHPFVLEAARALVARVERGVGMEADAKVERLYRLAYGWSPSVEEASMAREFLGEGSGSPAAWSLFAQALLESNEFAFVD